jgi:hypothetical protein
VPSATSDGDVRGMVDLYDDGVSTGSGPKDVKVAVESSRESGRFTELPGPLLDFRIAS